MRDGTRRGLIKTGIAGAIGATGVAAVGASGLVPPDARGLYGCGHTLTYAAHRLLTRGANAREFRREQISKIPHPKGKPPKAEEYARLRADGFKDWRLQVDGLVERPASLSIADIKSYPARSHITQLICEEGWSYIAEWTGAPLSHIFTLAGAASKARFAVVYSMDGWLDAFDMEDSLHAQTLITYGFNGTDLPVGHGGPLRLRIPRQMGYKSLKFIHRISLVESLEAVPLRFQKYAWYAGI